MHRDKSQIYEIIRPMLFFCFQISTDEAHLHSLTHDLGRRRAQMKGIQSHRDVKVIQAMTPLSELMGYSTDIRKMSSGIATYTMELSHYQRMSPMEQRIAIEKSMGLTATWSHK